MATFVDTFYKAIDLNAAVKAQYGSTATAVQTGQHLYNWAAQVNGQNQPLDLNLAVSTQYGTGYRLVHTGVHAYDWAAVRFTDLDLHVLPVLLIASDKFYDITGVQTGIARLRSGSPGSGPVRQAAPNPSPRSDARPARVEALAPHRAAGQTAVTPYTPP
jgi:hypothetical protein